MLNPFSYFYIPEQELNNNLISIFRDYQIIEYYLKWMYSYMHRGNINKNYKYVKDKTLGNVVSLLKKLDNSDNRPLLSANDYFYLKEMTKTRNYYIHSFFIDYLYAEHHKNYDDCRDLYNKLKSNKNEIHGMCENIYKIYSEITEYYNR